MNDNTVQPATKAEPEVVTIAATNYSAEDLTQICAAISEASATPVEVVPNEFTFKKSVDKETGVTTVREAVTLAIPYPTSIEAIAGILEAGGKQLELLQGAIRTIVDFEARSILNDKDGEKLSATDFPVDKITWETIANKPKATRGGGIPKEVWEAFKVDYIDTMLAATDKSEEAVTNAANLFVGKLQAVKTSKPVLAKLNELLGVYASESSNVENFTDVIEFLVAKMDTYMNSTDETLLEAL